MTRIFPLAIIIIFLSMTPLMAQDFAVGQIWAYKTRPSEPDSTLTIALIETLPDGGKVFHLSVDALSITNPLSPSGVSRQLPHVPFSQATLQTSVTTLLGMTTTLPDISEGYAQWKPAFDQGKAGIFNIPLSEIINGIEVALATNPTKLN